VTLVWYISGHGFGHASRDVEVLNILGRLRPDVRTVVRSAVNADLLRRTVTAPIELRPGACDTGIVQSTSVMHDDDATIDAAVRFYETFNERVDAEVATLRSDDVHLIVGDIPPLAFEVAARLGVPAIALANFTWDWIYEGHPGFADRAPAVLDVIRQAYRRATLGLRLPFAGGFETMADVRDVPLIARRPTRNRADTRAHFGIAADRPAALLSFGGYGLPSLDFARLDCLDTWTIVTTDRLRNESSARPASVVFVEESQFIDSGFRYEDLVGAVDVVMTKPGYGITAECIATNSAMLYTSRGEFREYPILVDGLRRFVRSRFIDQDRLFAGAWRESLDALRLQPPAPERMEVNGADVVAALIAQRL
jgi:L-arabinokinase